MYKLPPHRPEYRDEFISAIRNRKESKDIAYGGNHNKEFSVDKDNGWRVNGKKSS